MVPSSRFFGVKWHRRGNRTRKWKVQFRLLSNLGVPGKRRKIRRNENEEEAARVYDKAAIECGMLDNLNFHDEYLLGI